MPSIRIYNPDLSNRLAQRLQMPEHLTPQALSRLAMKALGLLQQEQATLPAKEQKPLWYVEGTIAFPHMRVAWDCAWVEQGESNLIDVVRSFQEETEHVYFPAARYEIYTPVDLASVESMRLPLVQEDPVHPGTYPSHYYQQAHNWAVIRALAATAEQYFQMRAASPVAFSQKRLIEALLSQDAHLLSLLPATQAPLVQSFRACPDWFGHELSSTLDL